MTADSREVWIDNMKGLGIALVVLGHMSVPDQLGKLIFSFHMPLFFFLSGYLFKGSFTGRYVLGKVDHLVIPYVVYALPLMLLAVASGHSVAYCARNLLLGNGLYTNWFLSSLFAASILGGMLVAICRNRIALMLSVFVICAAGWYLPVLQHPVVLSSHTWAPALAFWLCGSLCSSSGLWSIVNRSRRRQVAFLVLLVLCASLYLLNVRPSIAEAKLGNPCLFYPAGLALILLCALGCRKLADRFPVVQYLGRNSLVIMIWHVAIPAVMKLVWMRLQIDPRASLAWKLLNSGINLILLAGVVVLVDRYVPLLAGRVRIATRNIK